MGIRKHESIGRTGRRLVGVLLLLLSAAPVIADVPDIVSFTIEPNPVGRGDRFGVSILIDYPDPDGITVREPELPEGFEIRGGPSFRPSTYESPEGLRKAVHIGYTLRSNVSGRAALGAFEIESAEGEIVKTPERLVSIGLYSNRRLYIPLDVEWVGIPDRVYTGQAIPVILGLQRQTSILGIDRVAIEQPGNGVFAEAAGVGDIESVPVGETILFNLPAAAYIWTPSNPGRAILPSCSVTVGDLTGWSGEVRVEVLPLPERVVSTGAVGWFQYRGSVDTTSVSKGEEIRLFLMIEGRGNLNYLQVPDPEVDNAVLISRDEISDFQPSIYGYTGSRFMEHRYLPDEGTSEVFIDLPDFSWIEPDTGEVHSIAGDVLHVGIRTEVEVDGDTGEVVFPFEPETVDELTRPLLTYRYRNWKCLLWLIPGGVFFLVFLALPLRVFPLLLLTLLTGGLQSGLQSGLPSGDFPLACRTGTSGLLLAGSDVETQDDTLFAELVQQGRRHYENGEFQEAWESYSGAAWLEPNIPGLLYNESLALYRGGEIARAVTTVWKALMLNPGKMRYRRFLKWIESDAGLNRQLPPPFRLHPEIPYWAGILFLNAVFVIATFHRRRPKGTTLILLISTTVLFLVAVTGFAITGLSRNRAVAVVTSDAGIEEGIDEEISGGSTEGGGWISGESRSNTDRSAEDSAVVPGTEVKRIPKASTDEWFRFPEGQTVYAKGLSGQYVLVKTADGLLGWVEEDSLTWVTRTEYDSFGEMDTE